MRESSVYSDRLLMDGIFGVVYPADTPLTDLETAMVPNGRFLGEEDTNSRVSSRDLGARQNWPLWLRAFNVIYQGRCPRPHEILPEAGSPGCDQPGTLKAWQYDPAPTRQVLLCSI